MGTYMHDSKILPSKSHARRHHLAAQGPLSQAVHQNLAMDPYYPFQSPSAFNAQSQHDTNINAQ